jgi:hypothetical protein
MERYRNLLEAGRRDFLEACGSASKPSPNSWTSLEIIEHVCIVEDRYVTWLEEGDGDPPPRDPDNEMRLFLMIRNREERRQAPDAVWPTGRFKKLDEAVAAFNEVRNRAVSMADESLYSVGVTHPFFGRVNGAELMQLIDGHARRHAEQIRDLAEASA